MAEAASWSLNVLFFFLWGIQPNSIPRSLQGPHDFVLSASEAGPQKPPTSILHRLPPLPTRCVHEGNLGEHMLKMAESFATRCLCGRAFPTQRLPSWNHPRLLYGWKINISSIKALKFRDLSVPVSSTFLVFCEFLAKNKELHFL